MTGPLDRKRFTLIVGILIIAVALLIIYLSWVFVNVIIFSIFCAFILRPLDKKLRKITRIKNRQITAVLTITIVALIFIGVFLNIIFILGSELSKFEPDALQTDINMLIDYGMELIGKYIPDTIQENMKSNLSSSASSAILFIVNNVQRVVLNFISNIAIFAMQLGVVVFLLYYLLIDGENIVETFIDILPSNRVEIVREFLQHLNGIYNSLFNVYLVVCVLTGIIGGIGLMFLGVPYPIMWGAVIAVLALLPIVGPGTFYVPAAIYYYIVDEPVTAIVIVIFGWLFLETIPGNIIRPRLMMQHGNIHPIITLLSFTAPLFVVGAMGIIIGPAAYGFMLAIYRTYTGFEVITESGNQEIEEKAGAQAEDENQPGDEIQSEDKTQSEGKTQPEDKTQ
ncbi:MAG TPA: AI-2E family transporter [Methanosarcinales archaeon]|nr:AI-2E family transporter [Methanosarcinales archaeon]